MPSVHNIALDSQTWDYLLLSDVHLGSDLVPHLRPWARDSWLNEEAEVDARLIGLLTHYAERTRPTCLVAAGDLLDLVGVSLSTQQEGVYTQPTREEQRHGLGSAPDHVVAKIEAIAHRHKRVFQALCAFLAKGHRLVVVRGNHDIELHWRSAQRALVRVVCQHADDQHEAAQIATRIEICPWFFHVPNVLYVEHGHEFDAMCSYGDPLLPTCPRDSRRIRISPFSVMLREVARPTRGLSTSHYENVGLAEYMRLLANLGVAGSLRIAVRFARATKRLLSECMSAQRESARRLLHKHARERRFRSRANTSIEQLAALKKMYVSPAVQSARFVLRSLYLDRILAFSAALWCVVLGATLTRYESLFEGLLCALPALPLAAFACWGPNRDISPRTTMRRCAGEIAKLFQVKFVVMGHTHEPEDEAIGGDARYLNLGHWGSDDVPEESNGHRPPDRSTYALLVHTERGYQHQLMRWDSLGPRVHQLPCKEHELPTLPGAPLKPSAG